MQQVNIYAKPLSKHQLEKKLESSSEMGSLEEEKTTMNPTQITRSGLMKLTITTNTGRVIVGTTRDVGSIIFAVGARS